MRVLDFFGAHLGLGQCQAPAPGPWRRQPSRGAVMARRHHAQLHGQGLRHKSSAQHLPVPWATTSARARIRASATPPRLAQTVLPGRSMAAPQARSSPSEAKLTASHHCQAPTNGGLGRNPTSSSTGASIPATLATGVPRDLLCSLPSASPFLCFTIFKVERFCQDLNLLYHSLYAL